MDQSVLDPAVKKQTSSLKLGLLRKEKNKTYTPDQNLMTSYKIARTFILH